jgi:hypothetical protein
MLIFCPKIQPEAIGRQWSPASRLDVVTAPACIRGPIISPSPARPGLPQTRRSICSSYTTSALGGIPSLLFLHSSVVFTASPSSNSNYFNSSLLSKTSPTTNSSLSRPRILTAGIFISKYYGRMKLNDPRVQLLGRWSLQPRVTCNAIHV